MDSNLPPVPHLYVDEKRRSKKAIFAIVLLSFLILSVPLGVYLVSQKTNFLPQAFVGTSVMSEESIMVLTQKQSLNIGDLFKVDVFLKSDSDEANLAIAKIKFTQDSIEMVRIERFSTFARQWIEYSFDNGQGTVSLIAGAPNPGIKSSVNIPQFSLATLIFKAKKPALANISVAKNESFIYKNSDNKNILNKTNILTVNVSDQKGETSGEQNSQSEQTFEVLTPVGGKVYPYYQPVNIHWNPKDIERVIAISLYLNGENFGRISSTINPSDSSFVWSPSDTLLLPYITSVNTFQIGITAISKNGKIIIGFNDGPFGISASSGLLSVATSSAVVNDQKADLDGDNKIDGHDLSILFSNYNTQSPKNPRADINEDGKIGEIDLFLIRKLMIAEGLIKG